MQLLQYSATDVAKNTHIKLFTIAVKTPPPEIKWISFLAIRDSRLVLPESYIQCSSVNCITDSWIFLPVSFE